MPISKAELADLKRAKSLLENPGLAARLSSMLGSPLERGIAMLPARFQSTVQKASEAAMMKALDVAINSISSETSRKSNLTRDRAHKFAAATSGAVGGAFGLLALSVELPISTTIMLRSVADIAKSEGENIQHIETRLACLTVFAIGGRAASDDAAESGYFAARLAMSGAVSEASRYLAEKGMSKAGAPALIRLTSLIASRFGIVVSEKAAAQAIPIIGAASGALINTLFIEHFQNMARGHFIVRRLEKIHGAEPVRVAYLSI
ncbi:MAG: EcsC family protein [Rhodocyclaceae bacterium]|nr:EcsC family protein [Rhodocyclaceae bacterium]